MPVAVGYPSSQKLGVWNSWRESVLHEKFHAYRYQEKLPQRRTILEPFSLISQLEEPWMEWTQEVGVSITTDIEQILKSLASHGIKIPRPDEIRAYLFRHPDMRELLSAISLGTLQQLGNRVQLSLEVYHDPEIKDEYLALYARQEKYDESLLDQLDVISSQYEECLIDKSGWLLLTTDFQPPR